MTQSNLKQSETTGALKWSRHQEQSCQNIRMQKLQKRGSMKWYASILKEYNILKKRQYHQKKTIETITELQTVAATAMRWVRCATLTKRKADETSQQTL